MIYLSGRIKRLTKVNGGFLGEMLIRNPDRPLFMKFALWDNLLKNIPQLSINQNIDIRGLFDSQNRINVTSLNKAEGLLYKNDIHSIVIVKSKDPKTDTVFVEENTKYGAKFAMDTDDQTAYDLLDKLYVVGNVSYIDKDGAREFHIKPKKVYKIDKEIL